MFGDDPLEYLDRAQIDALATRLMTSGKVEVPRAVPQVSKLGKGQKRLKKLPGELPDKANPNETVYVSVGLPAYLVMGLSEEPGGLEQNLRIAARDFLVKRGKTWWYPKFLMRG